MSLATHAAQIEPRTTRLSRRRQAGADARARVGPRGLAVVVVPTAVAAPTIALEDADLSGPRVEHAQAVDAAVKALAVLIQVAAGGLRPFRTARARAAIGRETDRAGRGARRGLSCVAADLTAGLPVVGRRGAQRVGAAIGEQRVGEIADAAQLRLAAGGRGDELARCSCASVACRVSQAAVARVGEGAVAIAAHVTARLARGAHR